MIGTWPVLQIEELLHRPDFMDIVIKLLTVAEVESTPVTS
jgi:hypothetical protein